MPLQSGPRWRIFCAIFSALLLSSGVWDFMLKIPAIPHPPTSQYRSRYTPLPVDDNVDYSRLDIEDISDDSEDRNAEILEKLHLVRETFESLDLGTVAARVFEFHFFQDGNFSEWKGPETLKQLYEIYNGVQELIRKKIAGESIF